MSDAHAFEIRVARLERRCRVLTALLVAMAASAIAGCAFMDRHGGASGIEMRAETFNLVGRDGVIRGRWFVSDDGGVGLQLNDKNGKVAAQLATNDSASTVGLNLITRKNTRMSGTTFGASDRGSELSLADPEGRMRSLLYVESSASSLMMFDGDSKPRAQLTLEDGGSSLRLEDAKGTALLTVPSK